MDKHDVEEIERLIKERLSWCMNGNKQLIKDDIKETAEAIHNEMKGGGLGER